MVCTKEEVALLKREVLELFEDNEPKEWPLPKGKIIDTFIEWCGQEEEYEEIRSFFENLLNTMPNISIYDRYEECFYSYPRIFFWLICLKIVRFGYLGEPELKKRIISITERIILQKEKLLLVKEISEFINEKMQGLNISSYYNYEDWSKADEVVRHFKPSHFLEKVEKGNDTNKFYPYDLYEKIKEVIPPIFQGDFKYESFDDSLYKDSDSDENLKESDTENKKIESKPELPENILSKEMSDNEIIKKLKEYDGVLLDKATEDKNECIYKFIMRKIGIPLWPGETEEEFIDYVLKAEIKKCGSGRISLSHKHLYILFELDGETIEDDTIIWNSVHSQKSHFYDEDFSNKVSKVFLHRDDLIERILQVSLNEKVLKNLEDISKEIHLLTLIGTKKSFLKIWEILGTRKCKYDEKFYAEIINKWDEHFPIKLLRKEIENKNEACILAIRHSKNEYAVRSLFAILYKNPTINRCTSISDSGHLGYIEYYKLLINLSISIDDFLSGDDLEYVLFLNDTVRHWYSPYHKKLLLDIIGIMKNGGIFGQKIKKMLEKLNIDLTHKFTYEEIGRLNIDKIPFALKEEYCNSPDYIKAKFWVYEHKELDLRHDSAFSSNYYKVFRNIMLEKPFFFPKYSIENINTMDDYFYRELPFLDFVQQSEPQKIKNIFILWKYYLRKVIEESYENFKQEECEKLLLPIIPEYAEYLLSRTNDMFSTAIENIPYNEYKTFLTESRKQQIKICLKNNTIQKEEFDNLIALAENPKMNYYAWSDKEITCCLLPGTDLEKLNAILEPEFMPRIFEKSILWVMEHKDSELWLNAPWFGVQIFDKSYRDRPAIWAKHLMKVLDEWNGSENMLRRICIALGHLREPLGSKVPIKLREMAGNPQNENIKEDILIQLSLFNHENFRKMYHKGNEIKRIELCKRELIIGQNKEVKKKMQE